MKVYEKYLTYREYILNYSRYILLNIFDSNLSMRVAIRGTIHNKLNKKELIEIFEYILEKKYLSDQIRFEEIKFTNDNYYLIIEL